MSTAAIQANCLKLMFIPAVVAGVLAVVSGCEDPQGSGRGSRANPGAEFSEEQRNLADQIISVFENNTPVIEYGYLEYLDDGRGMTGGRAGFTSATGDMLMVVERYAGVVPDNPLADYIPRLRELAALESGDVAGLEALAGAWAEAAGDPRFRAVQDEVVDEEYYWPAVHHAEELGLVYPLSLLNLFDACIQHGNGEDPDGLPAVVDRACAKIGGAPADGIDEEVWLQAFMDVREYVLTHATGAGTREEWAESVGRIHALREIYIAGNLYLDPPVTINPFGTLWTLPLGDTGTLWISAKMCPGPAPGRER